MSRKVTFALVREGTSDEGLVRHARSLILRAGAEEAQGSPRTYSGTVQEKLACVLGEPAPVDLVFVHRDSDARDDSARRAEVLLAAEALNCVERVVPIIPVRETESWLLCSEAAIREVAGNPRGRDALNLPTLREIERRAGAKEILEQACRTASPQGTRRSRRTRGGSFSKQRATLLERLDIDGPVRELASWQTFVDNTSSAVSALFAARDVV